MYICKHGFKIVKETIDSFNGKILDALTMELNLVLAKPISHVIVSQGYLEFIGEYPWVKNVNTILKDKGYKVHVFACGENRRSFAKNDVEVIISKRLGVLRDPFSLDILAKILLTKKPSIAVIHGLQHLLTLSSVIIYFLRNVPMIIIVHGLYLANSRLLSFRDRVLKFILHLFRNSYLLIALTCYDRLLLLKDWGIPENKIRVTKVPLYINGEELQLIKHTKRDYENITDALSKDRNFTMLYVGRLSKEKRIDMLIRSVKQIVATGRLIHLIIVGYGFEKKRLYRLVKKLDLTRYIKFVGSVKHNEIWKYFLSCDVLVLPSKHEGFPRVILEAFACGKPVIASNVCGIPEIVRNNFNGLLFNNEKELTEKILEFLNNRRKLEEISKNIAGSFKDYVLTYSYDFLSDILGS
jgi:glycosyltransferase involved in cell wall biosynthesis